MSPDQSPRPTQDSDAPERLGWGRGSTSEFSTFAQPSIEQQWLDDVVADLAARHEAALDEDHSPDELDELAEERDRLAETRDVLAQRRADGPDAELDRDRAREDRSRSAADRDRAAVDRARAAVDLQHLREALASRALIGQAQGILMHQLGASADEALALLVDASQHRAQKLLDVAEQVVRDRLLPPSARPHGR